MKRDDEAAAGVIAFAVIVVALVIAVLNGCVSRCTSHPYDPKCIVTACPDVDAGS